MGWSLVTFPCCPGRGPWVCGLVAELWLAPGPEPEGGADARGEPAPAPGQEREGHAESCLWLPQPLSSHGSAGCTLLFPGAVTLGEAPLLQIHKIPNTLRRHIAVTGEAPLAERTPHWGSRAPRASLLDTAVVGWVAL